MQKQLTARSQTEGVYAQLRADVLTCRLEPGMKLYINELCDRYAASLSAVREALSRLTADSLVVAEPQKGFRVAPISRDDLIDLSRTRAKIEAICLREAVEKGDVTWETQVLAAHHFLARTPMRRPSDPALLSKEWDIRHNEFHMALASGCGSPTLMRIRQSLFEQSERYRFLSFPVDYGKRDVAAEHQAICDAALRRDPEGVAQLIAMHIERTAQTILTAMASWEHGDDRTEKKTLPAVGARLANGGRKSSKRKRSISVEVG